MSKITETNAQYYQGAQGFRLPETVTTTFDTDLVFGGTSAWDPNNELYALNNFKLYTSATGFPGTFTEYILQYTVINNTITFAAPPADGTFVVVQLNGKVIQTCKKSDVVFFAKRSLQEFSYDTLKSIKSSELTVPSTLSLIIPQDYVNYVSFCYIDQLGVKRPIYPANNLTTDPYYTFIQDEQAVPTQDNFGENIEGTSITEARWKEANTKLLNGEWYRDFDYYGYANPDLWSLNGPWNWGRLYGLDPKLSQANGWFGVDEREGKFTFSSNLLDKLVVLEYISDGLAYDLDTKVPKMAEDAMYKSILYNIVSTRANQPEYVVQRYKKDRYAALRNAKIRLSNIKLPEFTQIMRGKSKWIKH
jgi:hypothetical protein